MLVISNEKRYEYVNVFQWQKNISDISIPKTTPVIWIPSENVTKCYNCELIFFIKS